MVPKRLIFLEVTRGLNQTCTIRRYMMKPILLEVIAPMISSVEMNCRGCRDMFSYLGIRGKDRKACADGYPDDWKMAVEYLSEWIGDLSRLYRHRIRIRIIDAQSPFGLWKQVRHRVFRFPAFVVDREETYIGWDYGELETVIDKRIQKGVKPK